MLTVEVVGAPGAGKSTMVPAVMDGCRRAGRRPVLMDEVVPEAVSRTGVGRVVVAVIPRRWRHGVLWRLYRLFRLGHALVFLLAHPGLLRHLVESQRRRPDDADGRNRRVLHWYVRLCGGWRFLSRHLDPDEALIVDEGFVHRVVQLHTSAVERLSPSMARSYSALVPFPDLLVHVDADAVTCHRRVVDRGVWARWAHRSPEDVERYVHHAHEAIELIVGEARQRGGLVVEVPNIGTTPESVGAGLSDQVATALLGGSGTDARGEPPRIRAPRLLVPRPGLVRDQLQARVQPPAIGGEELEAVLGWYGLDRTGTPHNVGVGWRNPLVVVDTDQGTKVVKRYPARFDPCAVGHEHSLLARLADEEFPAVRLESAPDGSTLARVDGAHYGLFRFEPGRSLTGHYLPTSVRRPAIHQSGRLLAEFHALLAGFRPAGAHHLGLDATTGRPRRDLDWHLARLHELRTSPPPRSDDRARRDLVAASDSAARRLTELEERLTLTDLPTTMIHGDFGLHNVLVGPSGHLILHDFELARHERRLVDIVAMARRYADRELGWFMAGYTEISRLSTQEWACIDLVAEEYWLRGAVQSWSNFVAFGGPGRLRTATRRFERAATVGREGWHGT